MVWLKEKNRRLIVVSNRLPFYREVDSGGKESWKKGAGGLITALDPILSEVGGIWIGWDGAPSETADLSAVRKFPIENMSSGSAGKGYEIACVPLTAQENEEYYNRFSNGTLWALFHYFFEKSYIDYASWMSYVEINQRFAEVVADVADDDDIIWVQDFHLFLVPFFLRRKLPMQEIHFFLHIPFPHLDIFSILPWQRQILESLLCCNTVGFHHKQYYKNFKGAVTAYRRERKSLGLKSIEEGINTHFYANPISIDFGAIDKKARMPRTKERIKEIIDQSGAPNRVIGIDRMDYSKGIKERMLGLELLLEEHPELREKFFYYQLVIPSREAVQTYKDLKKEVDEIIGRINGKFSTGLWTPIHYNYGTVPFDELVALYAASDVALVTPLRDGMNLVCKEYIAAHPDDRGILVLSKFAGAIAEIKNCLSVNPYSIEDIAEAIYLALTMSPEEKRRRMKKMRTNIKKNDLHSWLETCLRHFSMSQGPPMLYE